VVEHHGQHRRHDSRPVDLVLLGQLHDRFRLEQRLEHRDAADRRDTEDPAHRCGVEHRDLVEVDAAGLEVDGHSDVVQVQELRPLVEECTLGQPRRAAGVHEDDRIALVRLLRDDRVSELQQVGVRQVALVLAVSDEHDLAQRQLPSHRGEGAQQVIGEELVDKDHFGL
jgi:hypothetical protein